MKKRLLTVLVIGVIMLGVTGAANATLVGDYVTSQHYTTGPYGTLATVIVQDGTADLMYPLGGSHYSINVDSQSIYVDYVKYTHWTELSFNGVIIDSLNDSSGNILQSMSIETNIGGWDNSRATFDADTVFLNWHGLFSYSDTYINVSLNFGGQQPVPEPATMLLFGTGIAGLAGARLRRKKQ